MLSWSYNVAAVEIFFRVGKVLPQSHRAGASATPALNRQGGNIRVAALYTATFIFRSGHAPTNVALVARPCAPAAQRADESSSSRSRLAKSYGRFAPLSLKSSLRSALIPLDVAAIAATR